MSCRVLKRSMENFVLNTLVTTLKEKGYRYLKGEFIPTPKNTLVKDFYKQLGFIEKQGYWYLSVNDYIQKETYIISEKQKKNIN
jgi:predicted enzyme involved in methoxymalonyl-ACP biosynthesis